MRWKKSCATSHYRTVDVATASSVLLKSCATVPFHWCSVACRLRQAAASNTLCVLRATTTCCPCWSMRASIKPDVIARTTQLSMSEVGTCAT
jgi:hypothetical protein